jgi:AcrR family transcriptional regulator
MADADGLTAVSMRRLAGELGVAPMTLYTYVPTKAELLDLMLDAVYLAMPRPPWGRKGWRSRAAAVADANRTLFEEHPWAARISTSRPPLGPGQMAKYEHELQALEVMGLDDLRLDSALTFLLEFVRAWARSAHDVQAERRESGMSDEAWWAAAAPVLEQAVDPAAYPTATRIGVAAGEALGAAYAPDHAWRFGLERVLAGLAALVPR